MPHGPHIAIIGAGPSGLMAAEILAKAGCRVSVYDQMPSPARKFLIAGRGGLNLTHSEPLETFIPRYREAADWLAPAIRALPPDALRAWCEGLGQETFIGSSGRIFPKSMKAAPLLRAWLKRLDSLGVVAEWRHRWLGWEGSALLFTHTATDEPVRIHADATLLALGGASWPRLGSDGGWVEMLQAHGVAPSPFRPSNCGFIVPWSDHFKTRFAGQPLKNITIMFEGKTYQGEAMITQNGIEGGVIYALSASLRDLIDAHGQAVIHMDLRPSVNIQTLLRKLQKPRGSKSFSRFLQGVGFSTVAIGLLRELTPTEHFKTDNMSGLAASIKALPLTLTATSGIQKAISSAGGIAREALDADYMLHNSPGVFAAGEMLNWEAPTGGYLLQGCFSTAHAAAHGILRYVAHKL
jgi:uncharacterized flavoprotein (TIGR03862 family)